ncbi:MAG: hypothetical protein L0Z53_06845 [Acidobacteriales bacterium]|nr:hypothetical protein [Terriglobales bacterium]
MPASRDQRLTASAAKANSSGSVDNAAATATFAAAVGTRHFVQGVVAAYAAAPATGAHLATLTYTYGGAAQTISFQVSVGTWQLYFGNNPVETDANTAVTLTVPASGTAGVFGSASIYGFSTKD